MTAAGALAHPWLRHVTCAGDGAAAPPPPLHAQVLSDLRAFHTSSRARRAALRALAATFEPAQLPAAAQLFAAVDADADGAISRDELRAALGRAGAGGAEVDSLFADMLGGADADALRWADFAAAALHGASLRRADAGQWARHVTDAFQALDADADGFLSARELLLRPAGAGDDADLAEADADGDGRVGLTLADFEALLRRSASAARVEQ